MKCELDYYLYNRDFSCILKETQLNSLGMCEDCIIVTIPNTDLQKLKQNQLKEIESRWASENG